MKSESFSQEWEGYRFQVAVHGDSSFDIAAYDRDNHQVYSHVHFPYPWDFFRPIETRIFAAMRQALLKIQCMPYQSIRQRLQIVIAEHEGRRTRP